MLKLSKYTVHIEALIVHHRASQVMSHDNLGVRFRMCPFIIWPSLARLLAPRLASLPTFQNVLLCE
jgi:hypothetical protein